MLSTTGSRGLVLLLVAGLLAGCGTASTPAPSPPASGGPAGTVPTATAAQGLAAATPPTATQAPSASPTPAYADTLRIGWDPSPGSAFYGFRSALTYVDAHQLNLGTVVFGGLYWYDASFAAVPDLADGPCLPQGDGTVIRCHLIEATFQDGTPVTADDVAYSYRLQMLFTQPGFNTFPGLEAVRVLDPRTVDFVLASVDSSFFSTGLATTAIFPRHTVESAYAAFVTATKGLKGGDLTKLADAIDAGMSQDPPVCTAHLDEAASLIARLGVPLYREDFSRGGTFDMCHYMRTASWYIRMAADSLGTTGLAAVAAAYFDLRVDWEPIGTGPYRFVSQDANGIRVEAWPGYHGGMAATRYIDFVPAKSDGSDLLDGSLDIYQLGNLVSLTSLGPAFQATASSHGLRVATLPGPGYFAMQYNVRPGRLFADVRLRKALQLCIDLPRVVDSATGGAGTPVYGPVMPGTWAYDASVPKPARDVAAARALIESAGWTPGVDGIYAKDGIRLAAAIPVRGDRADRVKMADLVAAQARDCGMDLRAKPVSVDQILGLLQYPHLIPGTRKPVDLLLGLWALSPGDPDYALQSFVSTYITDAAHPDGNGDRPDWSGFSDAALDALVKQAKATYDQVERTRLYQRAQQEIAAQQPYLFLWAANTYDVVRAAVTSVDGPLDLSVPNWAWQPERMVVEKAKP
jgi:ABC-type transport system substrate-binding protein